MEHIPASDQTRTCHFLDRAYLCFRRDWFDVGVVTGDWQNVKLVINDNTCLTRGERKDESGKQDDMIKCNTDLCNPVCFVK